MSGALFLSNREGPLNVTNTSAPHPQFPVVRLGKKTGLRRVASSPNRTGRCLSVSDLLDKSTQLMQSDTLFPRIDLEKYQSNAPVTMYQADMSDTEDEIGHYFQNGIETSGDHEVGKLEIDTDLRVTSGEKIGSEDSSQGNSCNDESRDGLSDLKSHKKKNLVRKLSYPVYILSSSLPVESEPLVCSSPSVWFGCHMTYLVIDKSLMVQIERRGSLLYEIGGRRVRLTAKICLLPGNIDMQKLKIASEREDKLLLPQIFFRNILQSSLATMSIGVCVKVKRGFFRKPEFLHEWTIPLSGVDFEEQKTAWKQLQWSM